MKRVSVDIQDLIDILMDFQEAGCSEVVFFEKEGLPAIADKEDPESIIMFQIFDKTEETKDGEKVH